MWLLIMYIIVDKWMYACSLTALVIIIQYFIDKIMSVYHWMKAVFPGIWVWMYADILGN